MQVIVVYFLFKTIPPRLELQKIPRDNSEELRMNLAERIEMKVIIQGSI